MPAKDPQPGDVFKSSPATSAAGDAHGNRSLPCCVVERLPRVAISLGRTTHPERDARTLESARNTSLGLSEDGWWQDRFQRTVSARFWGTRDFVYSGRLPSPEWDDLQHFWQMTSMLGRRCL